MAALLTPDPLAAAPVPAVCYPASAVARAPAADASPWAVFAGALGERVTEAGAAGGPDEMADASGDNQRFHEEDQATETSVIDLASRLQLAVRDAPAAGPPALPNARVAPPTAAKPETIGVRAMGSRLVAAAVGPDAASTLPDAINAAPADSSRKAGTIGLPSQADLAAVEAIENDVAAAPQGKPSVDPVSFERKTAAYLPAANDVLPLETPRVKTPNIATTRFSSAPPVANEHVAIDVTGSPPAAQPDGRPAWATSALLSRTAVGGTSNPPSLAAESNSVAAMLIVGAQQGLPAQQAGASGASRSAIEDASFPSTSPLIPAALAAVPAAHVHAVKPSIMLPAGPASPRAAGGAPADSSGLSASVVEGFFVGPRTEATASVPFSQVAVPAITPAVPSLEAPPSPAAAPASPLALDQPVEVWTARLAGDVRALAQGSSREATLTLRPEGLGDLVVAVEVQDGRLSVALQAATSAAHAILARDLGQLQLAAAAQGLTVDRATVDLATAATAAPASGFDLASRGGNAGGGANAGGGEHRAQTAAAPAVMTAGPPAPASRAPVTRQPSGNRIDVYA